MNIQKIPVAQINPAKYNPRVDLKTEDSSYIQIQKSIETFGCVQLLVWNSQTENLVSGHQRLKVLIDKGIQEVEVCVVELPLEREKSLNLALNKVNGRWDEDKLVPILDEMCIKRTRFTSENAAPLPAKTLDLYQSKRCTFTTENAPPLPPYFEPSDR